MKEIHSQLELANLSTLLEAGDWHEPDEQGLTAKVYGASFDNAGFWPMPRRRMDMTEPPERHPLYDPERGTEMYVVIYQGHDQDVTDHEPEPVAAINLCDLLNWASQPR